MRNLPHLHSQAPNGTYLKYYPSGAYFTKYEIFSPKMKNRS